METSGFRFAVVWGVALTAQLAACAGASPDEPPVVPGPEAVAGWRMVDLSHAYGDSTLYWPTDTTGFQLDNLHFPGIGAAAARLLVEDRRAALLGIDTASVDRGQSTDFIVHQVGAAVGVPNLENVADLSGLPPTGFLLAALPMKIAGGTGAPVRIVALIPPR